MNWGDLEDLVLGDVVLSLRIANEQDYYISGETIGGEALVALRKSDTTLYALSVTLRSLEELKVPCELCSENYRIHLRVQLIGEPVTLEAAGLYRFPFTLVSPEVTKTSPPTIAEECGRTRYVVEWYLLAEVEAVIPEQGTKPLTRERHLSREARASVCIFPAVWAQRNISSQPVYTADTLVSRSMKVSLCCPTTIPQAPQLCNVHITIDPCMPVHVKSVYVYLEKTLVVWSTFRAKQHVMKLPLGHIQLEELVSRKVELDGLALGWGLKSRQPGSFIFNSACLSYKLCLEIRVGRRHCITLNHELVGMGAVKPLQGDENTQGLPAYSREEVANDNSKF